jgi:1-acyl-sn-glycerol-3-phosphate acyltransferase
MPSHTLRTALRTLYRLLSRLDVCGLERLPLQGGCLLVTNHLSRLDPPLIYALIEREDATALVADKYQKYAFFRWIVEQADGIWISRESSDFQALKAAVAHLQGGGLLGIAPEGTRSHDGALLPAKTGAAYLADRARVPLVAVGVWGTEDAFRQLARLRCPILHVRVGEPFVLPPVERRQREVDLQRNTAEIMCQIAALLPAHYHGAYAGHPRLRDLLAGQHAA